MPNSRRRGEMVAEPKGTTGRHSAACRPAAVLHPGGRYHAPKALGWQWCLGWQVVRCRRPIEGSVQPVSASGRYTASG